MAKGFFRTAVFALLFAGLAAGASAQMTVSGGFALSYVPSVSFSGGGVSGSEAVDGSTGLGGNVYIDYLLPISIPMSLGFEIGIDVADVGDVSVLTIPLLLRAAYHFDLFPKLDLYVVGKAGYVIGKIESDTAGGFGFGFDAGTAYYFNQKIGLFAEVGFDRYMPGKSVGGYSATVNFNRFLTVGLSTKF